MAPKKILEVKNENIKKCTIGNYSIINYERSKNDIQKENKSNLNTIYADCKEEFAWGLSKRVDEVHQSYSMYDI